MTVKALKPTEGSGKLPRTTAPRSRPHANGHDVRKRRGSPGLHDRQGIETDERVDATPQSKIPVMSPGLHDRQGIETDCDEVIQHPRLLR